MRLAWTPWWAGLLLVAIATALPEAAAAVAAARRGQGDIVAGHVIGSSVFNLLAVLGGMAAVGGTVPVPASFVRLELPVAFLFALLLVPLLRGNSTLSRGEGGLLLVAFGAWVALETALLG
jgi:cation:H+ antiporter